MVLEARYTCAFCGEWVDTSVDTEGGRRQQYTEDCQVCCRPNLLTIELQWDAGELHADVDAQPEYEA